MEMAFLQMEPSPDWKGGEAVAARQWSGKGPAEPWKAGNAVDLTGVVDPSTEEDSVCSRRRRKCPFTQISFLGKISALWNSHKN